MEFDFRGAVEESLRTLEGERHYVPGAKLLQAVERRCRAEGQDFRKFLSGSNLKFSQYLENLQPRIRVHRRGAADMLVGFDSATFEVPKPAKAQEFQFRGDVHKAFARSGKQAIAYDPETDEFTERVTDRSVPVPSPNRDDLLSMRQRFCETVALQPEKQQALQAALASDSPLSNFSSALKATGLNESWQAFKSRQIRSAVEKWASENNIPIRAAWFRGAPEVNLRSTLLSMAGLMTDNELREIRIPLRVLEAYLRKLD